MAYLYCRVSTSGQQYGVSLNLQESHMTKLAHRLNWNVKSIEKVVGSAYKQEPHAMQKYRQLKNKKLIFYSVDRFSRNYKLGKATMLHMINNGNVVYFSKSKLKVDGNNAKNYNTFLKYLEHAQKESDGISERVKSAKSYARAQGMFLGGKLPYGYNKYTVDGSVYLEKNNEQMKIVKFIVECKTCGTTCEQLNNTLSECGVDTQRYALILDTGNRDQFSKTVLSTDLSYDTIANILNSYKLGDNVWKSPAIYSIYTKHKNVCFTNSDIDGSAMSDVDVDDLTRIISEDLYFN
jgi:DNA invertase Pin-like site-specific DNA recombinase